MKIYIAGLNMNRGFSQAINYQVVNNINTPHMLESFHYVGKEGSLGNRCINTFLEPKGQTIFLDSGAFSVFTKGATISCEEYAEFIINHQHLIHTASNLDDVSKNEQKSYDNQKQMEKLGAKVQPVFHCREDPKWLDRYIAEGYDYVFIGGMVPESSKWLKEWLDWIWADHLTDKDGMPLVKVHGFGLTTMPLVTRYPWYSVDSASWVMSSSFGNGQFSMLNPTTGIMKDYTMGFSDKSPSRKDLNAKHFDALPKAMQERVRERLWELEQQRESLGEGIEEALEEATGLKQGYYPETLASMYGWRRHINIKFYEQFNTPYDPKPFKLEQETLF